MQNNAYFQISIKDDGTYVRLYPPTELGEVLMISEIKHYLSKIGINISASKELTESLVKAIAEQCSAENDGDVEIKLSDERIKPVEEKVVAMVSRNMMTAQMRVYPASEEGTELSKTEIMEALEKAGIVHGITEESIEEWLEDKCYCTDIPIALGTLPEKSRDAVIDYLFDTTGLFRPTYKEDGSVDFHELNILNDVSEGDKLAILTPEYQGEFGMNVLGKELPSEKPQKKILKYGKNTILSNDGCVLFSTAGGYVELERDKVIVHDVYMVKGNVGTATGDIDFDGIVRITGDVQTGYTVKATKDIFVMGVVEGATLIAGRDIVIASGVHGAGRADITAGGEITVNFIQESVVCADGDIYAGSILFSKVTSKGSIVVCTNKGLVKGGTLCAKTLISVKTVGSAFAGAHTQLTVGANPDDISILREMESVLGNKRAEQTKLSKTLGFLKRKKDAGEQLQSEHEKLIMALPSLLARLEDEIEEFVCMYDKVRDGFSKSEAGKIIIEGIVYEGSSIGISNASYYIQEDLAQCQFVKNGSEIEVMSL